MAKKQNKPFDFARFITGVKRPERVITLCTDPQARIRLDGLIAELDSHQPNPDESLAGDPRRDQIVEQIRALNDDRSIWTEFTVRAPTREGNVFSVMNAADVGDSEDSDEGSTKADRTSEAILHAEARLISDCLVAVDGNPVSVTFAQAEQMQREWPADLINDLAGAVRDFGSDVNSIPFSQRLSLILETDTSSQS